jgi:hypothetical protein
LAAAVAAAGVLSAGGAREEGCAPVVDPVAAGAHRTIQAAVDALPASGPCAVTVKAGTYAEQVIVSGRNLRAAHDGERIRIYAEGLVVVDSPGDYGFVISGSRFLTIEGFTIAGAGRAGILLDGGDAAVSSDVTIARNDVHNNVGGIFIGPGTVRAWLVNNLVRNNDRNGITLQTGSPGGMAPSVVNNTIVANGWNGVSAARDAEAYLVNNLIVGNGAAAGATGGRWGILRERSAGAGRPQLLTLVHNVLYANGASASGAQRGDLGNAGQLLDAEDTGSVTTTGGEGDGVAGCAFRRCNAGAPLSALFDPPGYGPTFKLVRGSPAQRAGVGLFERDGRNWVPSVDFEGDRRSGASRVSRAPVDAGYDEAVSRGRSHR